MDTDLDYKAKKVTEKFSESLHIVANEPSLALYRLQEHVRKTLPVLSEKRIEMKNLQQEVQGMCYDADYASNAVKRMHKSGQHFSSIDEQIKKAIQLKQEMNKNKTSRSSSIPNANQPHSSSSSSAGSSPARQVPSTQETSEKSSSLKSGSDKQGDSGSESSQLTETHRETEQRGVPDGQGAE
ncbi:BLOC-1-related complex subunit 8-like isoform X2 [Ptychodera flava]